MDAAATHPAYIVGSGVVSCAGIGKRPLWDAVISQEPQLKTTENNCLVGRLSEDDYTQLVKEFSGHPVLKALKTNSNAPTMFSGHYLTVAALDEAMAEAGWSHLTDEDGLILATTTGQIPLWEEDLLGFLSDRVSAEDLSKTLRHQTLGVGLAQLKNALSFSGRSTLVTSACSASSQALVLGQRWLSEGRVKRVLVGSTEMLCKLTVRGFHSFQLLSKCGAMPFDRERRGINLAEGAAFVCLDSVPGPKARAQITGGGLSSDAFHMTSPEPEGKGCQRAMRAALINAGLEPAKVDWVHAHGTGSVQNDAAEAAAISVVFGNRVPVSSTKSIHGHPLATSGLMETVLDILAIDQGVIPGTATLQDQDERIAINVRRDNARAEVRTILNNALGFGGANCSFVIQAMGAKA